MLLVRKWLGAAPLLAVMAPAPRACYAVHKLIASTLQASGQPARAAVLSGSGAVWRWFWGWGGSAGRVRRAGHRAGQPGWMNALVLYGGHRASWRGWRRVLLGAVMLGALARPFHGAAAAYSPALCPGTCPPPWPGFARDTAIGRSGANVCCWGRLLYAGACCLPLWRIAGLPAGAEQHVRRLLAELSGGRPASPEQP